MSCRATTLFQRYKLPLRGMSQTCEARRIIGGKWKVVEEYTRRDGIRRTLTTSVPPF